MILSFIYSLASSLFISLGSLLGVVTLAMNQKKLNKILFLLVSLSAGALMGGAFLHLLPEAQEKLPTSTLYMVVLASFTFFFFIEKVLHWRHCHDGECDEHTFGVMNLFGDAFHNFIDGLIIAATYMTDIRLGLVTTLAVALHEIPQEISDFGVLLYSGFSKGKALKANFLVALTAIGGTLVGFIIGTSIEPLLAYLLPFTAGGFIYIAASDLIPEIRKETKLDRSLASIAAFTVGMCIMMLFTLLKI